MSADLSVEIGSLKLKNPVMVASGTFGYGTEYSQLLDVSKLGALLTKTITLRMRPGNPSPRIWEVGGGMLNSIGLANVGVDAFIAEKLPVLKEIDTTVVVNIAGSSIEEYWEVTEKLESHPGFEGFEINISCPNVKDEGMAFGSNPKVTEQIVKGVRERTQRTIIPKLTPNVTSISEIARVCEASGADAISLINTLVGLSVDIETRRPRLATICGGYSGPTIKPVALAKVFEVFNAVSIPVIGIGGISNLNDAVEFFITGATAIQVGTANFVNPQTSIEIIEGLPEYCQRHNLENIRDLIGTLKKN